jgi:hypothetical protein
MQAQEMYAEYVAAVEQGAFAHLDAPPVVPIEGTVAKREPRKGYCASPRHRIDEPWHDKDRGYKPGEMTTRDWVVAIMEILLEAPNAKMGQSVVCDIALDRMGGSKGRVAMRVTASLYWLRVVGLVHECEKRSPAPKKRATVHWQLTKVVR